MERGYIKLWRKIIDSPVFADAVLLKLWILCLSMANYKTTWASSSGIMSPIRVEPGHFITGRYDLHSCYHGPKKRKNSTPSPSTLWRKLEVLQNMQKLNINSTTKYSIISICNWKQYQQVEQQLNNNRTTTEQQLNTSKEGKERKEVKPHCSNGRLFESFWVNYPRKVGKTAALKAWQKIQNQEVVLDKIKRILPEQKVSEQWTKDGGQYIPYPATYLNQGRWEDEI